MKADVRLRIVLTAALFLASLAASEAGADVIKNCVTGETLKGTLTDQKINKLVVFKIEGGGTKFIDPAEWEVIEKDAPAPKEPEPKETAPASKNAEPKAAETRAYVIPISGPIMDNYLIDAIEKALKEAKVKKANLVIFRMNTPGGRVDLGDKIIQIIQGIDWATTVAWVQGDEKRSLSCGAFISLATHKIYMASGTIVGAATPFRVMSGSAAVDEKMTSAFRARFRSLAQERGHPTAIADAMVDNSTSVVQVFLDGKQQLVTEEEAKQMEQEHKKEGTFKRGKTVSKPGKLVTLTSNEALEFGVVKGIADDEKALMQEMGFSQYTIDAADWLPDWVEKQSTAAKETIEKYRSAFNLHMDQAIQNDPRHQSYTVKDLNRTFADDGKRWRHYSDLCLTHLKQCATALTQLEKMSKDDHYQFAVPQEMINDMKTQMESHYQQLMRERNLRQMP
ncbi:MAG TPA: hypothetical protein VNA25_04665 [Phycisphaerae bacterium]|nr:hypothetical protein [Phycisphaerae bacterium]